MNTQHRRLAVVLAGAAAFFSLYAPQSLMPLLHDWLGDSAALAGLIVSAGTFGVAVAAPFVGLLADRVGRRRVIVAAAFLVCVPALAAALARSPEELFAARLIQGLLLPGIFAVTVAYIGSEWAPGEAREVTALYVAGTIGGGFCGRMLSGLVAEFSDWRWGFAALAIGQLALALLIRAWLPPDREQLPAPASPLSTMRALLRRADLRGAYAVGFTLLFALVGGFTYVTLRLAAPPFSLGPAALSSIFAVYLLGVLVTPLGGRLLNRFGHARLLVLAWLATIVGLLLSLSDSLVMIGVAFGFYATGLFVAQTCTTSFVAEASGEARASSVGLYVFSYYLGGSAGGVLPALAWNQAGWTGVALLLIGVGVVSMQIGYRSFRFGRRPTGGSAAPLPEAGGEAP